MTQLLRSVVGPTSVKRGCMACRVHEDLQDEDLLEYVEEWQTEEDWRRHVRSEDYRRVIAIMESGYLEPEITIGNVVRPDGLALIRELRE